MESISEKTKVSMLADVDDAHIDIIENQEKVIRSKYIKDDPSVEVWLRRVVRNIALAELIYYPKFHKKIFDGVKHAIEKVDTGNGKFSNLYLIHKDMNDYNERTANFSKFMSNLYELVAEDEKAHLIVNETEKKFYDMLSKWKFLPNSPTLMNAGRRLQQLSACYVLPIEDSIEGWMKAATDAAVIHRSGGGTGFSASRVRSSGSIVGSTRGIATGPMSPFIIINATTEQIKQGGQRRGANMGILSVYHPNIREFIEFKKPKGQLENFNISVALDENFMNKVEQDGEIELVDPRSKEIMAREKAKDIFDLMVKCAWETGDPGFVFIDRINASGSNPTPALGEIESTNPCVTGDTLISTEIGLMQMKDLVEKYHEGGIKIITDNRVPLEIKNTDGTVSLIKQIQEGTSIDKITRAFCTGIKEVYEVRTKNSRKLKATADHKLLTFDGWIEVRNCLHKQVFVRDNKNDIVDYIVSVKCIGKEYVYDLTEPRTLSFITNGFVSLDCGEQPLLPYEPCNLGSINLSKFVRPDGSDMDWNALAEIIELTTHFLDNVIEVNNYPLPEIEKIAKGNRRIGLGVMGWAETLVMLGIPYDSEAAIKKAEQVMEFVNKNCLKSSEKLAETRGVFPNFKDSIFDENGKYFRIRAFPRNCARTTIAPTGTIAICAALQGSGIEPFFSIAYIRYNAQGIDQLKEGKTPSDEHTFFEYNRLFGEVAKKNNFFGLKEKELWKKISENHGSVRGIKEIPEHIQKVFCSSYDVTTEYHIMQQAAFQRHTDNAVSKTINMPNSATVEDVWNAYFFAYKQGVKGVTVYRDGSKSFQVLSNTSQVKTESKEEDGAKKKFIAATVRSRPEEVSGTTYKIKTGYGSLFVTVNNDEEGAPFEIFATTGKTGGVLAAKAEAICRLISLNLRAGIGADEIIEQLKGIRGPMPTWSKYGVVFSIPDAIAKILAVHINRGQTNLEQFASEEKQAILHIPKQINENAKQQPLAIADIGEIPECPDCRNILQFGEGCAVCHFCGYSKCS